MTSFAMRSLLVLPATIALTAGVLSAPASAEAGLAVQAADLPTCTHFSSRKVTGGVVRFPSVGADTRQTKCKLQQYDHNWGVVALQQWLLYCNKAKQIDVDGIYGPITRDVVTWIQAVEGINVDGVYGPETMNVLRKAVFSGNRVVGCV
ncbi:peptidoglycan-binding domain-containing protein [Actinomadura welshii]